MTCVHQKVLLSVLVFGIHSYLLVVGSKMCVRVCPTARTLPLVCHSHTALPFPAGHCHIQQHQPHLMARAGFSDTRLLHVESVSQSLLHCSC